MPKVVHVWDMLVRLIHWGLMAGFVALAFLTRGGGAWHVAIGYLVAGLNLGAMTIGGVVAGLIVAVFMHMVWERLAMVYFILLPPLLLMVLVAIGALEADYAYFTRAVYFLQDLVQQAPASVHHGG